MLKFRKKQRKNNNLPEINNQELETDVHLLDVEEILKKFESHKTNGLTQEKAYALYKKHGPNSLTPPKQRSKIIKIFVEMFTGISLLLNIGGILCIVSYFIAYYRLNEIENEHLYLGIILLVITLFTTLFGHFQEAKSLKLMESFSKLLPKETVVIRNSRKIYINSDFIVVGDIIILSGGDMVPADTRILTSNSLKVDNSSLTGETEPQYRFPLNANANYLEAENMVFAFTYIIEGTATGIVVSTGDKTVIGQIAGMTAVIPAERSTLSREIHKFVKIITFIAFLIGIVFFILSMTVKKSGLISSIVFFIGILVANVPEGLLVTVSISLALTAKRMASKNIVVKQLESVETLGSASVICSDKTGTITQNKMTVSHLWIDNNMQTIYLDCERNIAVQSKAEKYMSLAICICNRAEYREIYTDKTPIADRLTIGDPTESALLKFYDAKYGNPKTTRRKFQKIHEIPFNSNTKINLCIHRNLEHDIVTVKGAPERVFEKCKTILINNEHCAINDHWKRQLVEAYELLGKKGERVLGVAFGLTDEENYHKKIFDIDVNYFIIGRS